MISKMCATCPTHFILLHLIVLIFIDATDEVKFHFIKLTLLDLMETQCMVPRILNLGTRYRKWPALLPSTLNDKTGYKH